ncbi:N-acetylglucosaminyl deacetylase, LmbE family [Pseudobutyrivibrio sp. AR14]|uniref:PIG-L family deacetylase n=1 Tax=Pseudobutyrivibrio ruminis TaxID=46206 RepID=A0A2G3ECI7_9FIRM|nr:MULTISPECIES: PIG-L family deacetylase [Pseudobutyrivibrio]PHU40927.1 PIG-L family deacetylase [Pseudobutyrivibrio ruminis]SCY23688.1 N-acetylglucosaminyl deacetylase, LmbE family [Pseudobutyrivibrio sp. AR14]
MKKILVFAAHPDDELLGLGGTIRRLVNEGVEARAVIMAEGITSRASTREEADKDELEKLKEDAKQASEIIGYSGIDFCGLPDNRMDGLDLLSVIKLVFNYVEKYKPDTIFTHHHGDLNIDHRITCEAVLTACRPVGNYGVKRIYAFETPSSTEWNYNYTESFNPNVYFDISDTLEAKIKGMGCYKSESAKYPHPRSPESLSALAQHRGSNVGMKYAEAFMLLREVL